MTDQDKLDQLVEEIQEHIPAFEIRWKAQSYPDDPWRRNIVDRVASLFVGEAYFTWYVTTIFPYVYYPESYRDDPGRIYRVLRHEYVHLRDELSHPIWFPLSYAAILPIGLTMRAHWEARAWAQSFIVLKERHGKIPADAITHAIQQFSGRYYAWMDLFTARRRILKLADDVESGEKSEMWPY